MINCTVDGAMGERLWDKRERDSGCVIAFPSPAQPAPPIPPLSSADRRRLGALRELARRSSLACRPDCMIGCVYGRRVAETPDFCAAEQFRAFVEVTDRILSLYRPGAEAVSTDEQWLLRLTNALTDQDVGAASALIAFRVRRAERRRALAMAGVIAACIAEK